MRSSRARANRDTTIIALGGGVVGDIAGFRRGLLHARRHFMQVPTTLLAQVDSSVGGKTGVNHRGRQEPDRRVPPAAALVLIDTDTLDTLPDRELQGRARRGHQVRRDRRRRFLRLARGQHRGAGRPGRRRARARDRRSCELKAEVVAEDEREAGAARILNFGHTFGHAIEHCQGYGDWLHGEAVAAGMVMAAR